MIASRWVVLGFLSIVAFVGSVPSSTNTIKQKAREIAEHVVSDRNRDEAVRLMLAMQSEYSGEARYLVQRCAHSLGGV